RVDFSQAVPTDLALKPTPALEANRDFFNVSQWAKNYFEACHRSEEFKARWLAATGSWDSKVVVDIGCGPGNLYATVGSRPETLIGVDVAQTALQMAEEIGYTPLLADAHALPLKSEFADIVALNATLHHCQDMVQVLEEAARLVRPGGLLIIDHDPQRAAWNYKRLGMAFYRLRHLIYHYCLPDLDMDKQERTSALATEIHHHPGDGVTAELFMQTLLPRGFNVNLYPHNQTLGAEVLAGDIGNPPHWRYWVGQRLSGIDSKLPEAALSLMCVAQRHSL
ncbi:MAG: class I SAM-dependent methyltransferase, partial [Leptolyngbyaceae cyanobacterium SL_1_1]|nr:class I SAM-dependent methyltransferase [Leptolyngbyaceae cyanobacterium SL_1_1]